MNLLPWNKDWTVEANVSLGFAPDLRNYGVGAQIILDLGFNNFKVVLTDWIMVVTCKISQFCPKRRTGQ